ncbi:hypothetical protein [Motilibacter deserti]|uniref:Uncharacterized protein n=1 Tax=Motilibacter deserti TaxID=2714956 RepID=A0ABX0GQJ1_9ACTN|nr:hypothetical protein [Motilibacter deserti]NHC12396.1 hypothetical protein [Motilibacter deserti]
MVIIEAARASILPTALRIAVVSAAAALPFAVLSHALDYPEWTRTLSSFVVVLAIAFFPLGLVFRLVQYGVWWFVNGWDWRETTYDSPFTRAALVRYSTPVVYVGTAFAAAAVVLALGSGLGRGDYTP